MSRECEVSGIENAARFLLENVRGSLETTRGNYEEALAGYQLAFTIAQRIGDDERACISAGNTAMCFGRLGNHQEQIHWAQLSLERAYPTIPAWRVIRSRFHLAWGYAMAGEAAKAISTAETAVLDLGDSPDWLLQGFGLLEADIYQLSGESQRARKTATEILERSGLAALSGAYAGTVARWVALTCLGKKTEVASAVLRHARERLNELDMIDQAEVLAAIACLEATKGGRTSEILETLNERLRHLPTAIPNQLRRLGVLVNAS
jgi:tetratricopeptide (TPR) repeat protein